MQLRPVVREETRVGREREREGKWIRGGEGELLDREEEGRSADERERDREIERGARGPEEERGATERARWRRR